MRTNKHCGLIITKMLISTIAWLLFIACDSVRGDCKDASTVGRTFVFGATHGRNSGRDNEIDSLHISSKSSGIVTVQTIHNVTTHNISEGLTTIDIPKSLRHDQKQGKQQKGIVITADTDVSAYVFQNYPNFDSAGITLLPIEVLGTSYVVASYEPYSIYYKSYFVVVSFVDRTYVEITLRANGSTTNVIKQNLNKFESYYIKRPHDVSSSIVTSSHPVGVFSGVDCLQIPVDISYGNCDRGDTQVIPNNYMGTEYMVPSMFPRLAYMVRIMGIFSETNITITNDTDTMSISISSSGKFEDIYLGEDPVIIQSDHPVAVYQFAVSEAYDHTHGSEVMVAVPPINQYSSEYLFPTQLKPNYYTWTYRNFASIIIDTNLMDGLLVNDTALQPVYNQSLPAPMNNFSVVTFELEGTSQNITHENGSSVKFGLFAYGQNDATGYGLIGGRQFQESEPINLALGKPASQSSHNHNMANGLAYSAVDGNRNQNFSAGSCTHTLKNSAGSWWMVDLLGVFNISSVTIYNREDCCPQRLDNAHIDYAVNRRRFHTFQTVRGNFGSQRTINMKNIQARYIRVRIGHEFLSVCEVEVYGVPAHKQCPVWNIPTTTTPKTTLPATKPSTFTPKTTLPATKPTTFTPKTTVPATKPSTFTPKTTLTATKPTTFTPKTTVPATKPSTFTPKTTLPATKSPTSTPKTTLPVTKPPTTTKYTKPTPTTKYTKPSVTAYTMPSVTNSTTPAVTKYTGDPGIIGTSPLSTYVEGSNSLDPYEQMQP